MFKILILLTTLTAFAGKPYYNDQGEVIGYDPEYREAIKHLSVTNNTPGKEATKVYTVIPSQGNPTTLTVSRLGNVTTITRSDGKTFHVYHKPLIGN